MIIETIISKKDEGYWVIMLITLSNHSYSSTSNMKSPLKNVMKPVKTPLENVIKQTKSPLKNVIKQLLYLVFQYICSQNNKVWNGH